MASSSGYGEIKAAIIDERRPATDGDRDRTHDGNGQPELVRRERPVAEAAVPEVAAARSTRASPRVSPSRRFHPVHGIYRAHLGVDYGAPYGTPVRPWRMASSSSPGIPARPAGWFASGTRAAYQTAYLHLSSFAPGHPRRRARDPGPAHRARRRDGHRHGPASRLPHHEERPLRRSDCRAQAHAEGRADRGRRQLPAFLTLRDEVIDADERDCWPHSAIPRRPRSRSRPQVVPMSAAVSIPGASARA